MVAAVRRSRRPLPPDEAGRNPAEAKRWLRAQRTAIAADYLARPDARRCLAAYSAAVDAILAKLWSAAMGSRGGALVAVGGYGRGALFPHSDVDLLILRPEGDAPDPGTEAFVGMLWDCGIEPGTSVRSVSECVEEAAKDITVDTSLLEMRRVAGNARLAAELARQLQRRRDPKAFFTAKAEEQQRRHERFQEAAYNLEPNIKESPGGLRDLQTVLWVSRAAGLGESWGALAASAVITPDDARSVARAQRVLQDLRLRLHLVAGRREDRLVFDHQIEIARQLGIEGTRSLAASDLLMRHYYRAAKSIWRFNQMALATLRGRLLSEDAQRAEPIDHDFRAAGFTLDVVDERLFCRAPERILDAFLHLQRRRDLENLSPRAMRALAQALPTLGRSFHASPENRARFLAILRGDRLTWTLRRMSRYGVLGRYLPAFGRVTGQMQHDLFHVYTVDEHILMVIRNLRRLRLPKFSHEHPFCSRLMQAFDAPEILYIAALFHDIAKGRGGDHSELGAVDAGRFCRAHGLSRADTRLVQWLVESHLVMSATAQKQDIGDPEVVSEFAARAGDERSLTALYLLTVADIRGTSPKVWNAWKAQLLEDLFLAARDILRGNADFAQRSIEAKKAEALAEFAQYVPVPGSHAALWARFDDDYFQRFGAREIAWHARALWERAAPEEPVVRARLSPVGEGLQVLVYAPDQPGLFASITGFFDRQQFSVAEAKVYTTTHGYALDTFQVLAQARGQESPRDLIEGIERGLRAQLAQGSAHAAAASGRVSRWVKHFPIAPQVSIRPRRRNNGWQVFVSCADRPGLLSRTAQVFLRHGLNLVDARVTTLGARAEDTFELTGALLDSDEGRRALAGDLERELSR